MKQLVYLASPYSSPEWTICNHRFTEAARAAGEIFRMGFFCFSPICHTHPIKENTAYPQVLYGTWEYWCEYDRRMIWLCDQLWVLTLDGWFESQGVSAEIQIARELKKPIKMMRPQEQGSYLIEEAV